MLTTGQRFSNFSIEQTEQCRCNTKDTGDRKNRMRSFASASGEPRCGTIARLAAAV